MTDVSAQPDDKSSARESDSDQDRAARVQSLVARRAARRQKAALAQEDPAVAEAVTAASVRKATIAMLIATLMLLVFNSDGLRSYARNLPESAAADQFVIATNTWHAWMDAIGFAAPKRTVQDVMDLLRSE